MLICRFSSHKLSNKPMLQHCVSWVNVVRVHRSFCFHFFMLLIRFLFHFICPCFKGLHNFVRCLCLASSILNSLMPILLRLNKLLKIPIMLYRTCVFFVVALDFESHHFFHFLDLNSLTSLLNFSLLLAAASDSERSLLISRFSSSHFVLYSP